MWRTPSLVILMKKVIALLLSVVWLYESKPYNVNHDCYVLNGSTREHVRSMLWNIVPNGTFLSWTITRWRHQHFLAVKKKPNPQLAIDQFPGGRHQLISRKPPGWCGSTQHHHHRCGALLSNKVQLLFLCTQTPQGPIFKTSISLCESCFCSNIQNTPGIQAKLNA